MSEGSELTEGAPKTRERGRKTPPALVAPARLTFAIPGPDEPGFIRRQRTVVQLSEALRTGGLAAMDDMIAFLLQFVAEPLDRDTARELIYDLSRDEYGKLLDAIKREDAHFLS